MFCFHSILSPEVAKTLKTMVANHVPLQKTRPNPLTMPPKRAGLDGGIGTPPLSSGPVSMLRIIVVYFILLETADILPLL